MRMNIKNYTQVYLEERKCAVKEEKITSFIEAGLELGDINSDAESIGGMIMSLCCLFDLSIELEVVGYSCHTTHYLQRKHVNMFFN